MNKTQFNSFTTTTYAKDLKVSNKLFVNQICPYSGDTVTIDGLVIPNIDCLTLSATETVVGCDASNGTGVNNTAVGISAGQDLTTGVANTLLGHQSGQSLTAGNSNTLIGVNAGKDMTLAGFNTVVGVSAGNSLTAGNSNTVVGAFAGQSLTLGATNVLIGGSAGNTLTTGVNNTILGHQAGINTSNNLTGCVLIGNQTGDANATDNRLMIDNSNTTEPLIDGDFAGDTLQVNGVVTLGQTSNTTNVHEINGAITNSSTGVSMYLTVVVNTVTYKIPLHTI